MVKIPPKKPRIDTGNKDNPYGNKLGGIIVQLVRNGEAEGNQVPLSKVRDILPKDYQKNHMAIQSIISFTEKERVLVASGVEVVVIRRPREQKT